MERNGSSVRDATAVAIANDTYGFRSAYVPESRFASDAVQVAVPVETTGNMIWPFRRSGSASSAHARAVAS
jgi:hypothetical protein